MSHRLTASVLLVTAIAAAAPTPAHAIIVKTPDPVQSSTTFALDAYAELAKQPGNVAFSPASVFLALSLLQQGAGEQDARTIGKAMRFPMAYGERGLQEAYRAWLKSLTKKSSKTKLEIANGIWTARSTKLSRSYVQRAGRSLAARVAVTDFARRPDRSRKQINAWIAAHTGKKIKELLPDGSVDQSTDIVLANAIYFKGTWKHEFDPKATKEADFHLADGTTAKVKMMYRAGKARYGTAAEAAILELPYAGSTLAMDLILPADGKELADLEPTMAAKFPTWIAALSDTDKVHISMPRFTVEQSTDLQALMTSLGLGSLFSSVDLSRMMVRPDDHALSGAFHQVFVAVDEHGTEAAAATALVITRTSIDVTPTFNANRPFLWAIRDTKTGTILFLGRMADPR